MTSADVIDNIWDDAWIQPAVDHPGGSLSLIHVHKHTGFMSAVDYLQVALCSIYCP